MLVSWNYYMKRKTLMIQFQTMSLIMHGFLPMFFRKYLEERDDLRMMMKLISFP